MTNSVKHSGKVFIPIIIIMTFLGLIWYQISYKPTSAFEQAMQLLNNGQKYEANEALNQFIKTYPGDKRLPVVYGKLFNLNLGDNKKTLEYLDVLQKGYPSSPQTVEATITYISSETDKLLPLYNKYYNTGLGKDDYYSKAENLLRKLSKVKELNNFVLAGGNKVFESLNKMVNPTTGGIEFKFMTTDGYGSSELPSSDIPTITLTKEDGSTHSYKYDNEKGTISAENLPSGTYVLFVSIKRYEEDIDYAKNIKFLVIPGRKYIDIFSIYGLPLDEGISMKTTDSNSILDSDSYYMPMKNEQNVYLPTKKIALQNSSLPPSNLSNIILPDGISIQQKSDCTFIDLDNDGLNELVGMFGNNEYGESAILHWNGVSFEKQATIDAYGGYMLELKQLKLKGVGFPAIDFIYSGGGSGIYPQLTIITWDNEKQQYKFLWNAMGGDQGDWEVKDNSIIARSNLIDYVAASHGDGKRKFYQEFTFDGSKFVFTNQYASLTIGN